MDLSLADNCVGAGRLPVVDCAIAIDIHQLHHRVKILTFIVLGVKSIVLGAQSIVLGVKSIVLGTKFNVLGVKPHRIRDLLPDLVAPKIIIFKCKIIIFKYKIHHVKCKNHPF